MCKQRQLIFIYMKQCQIVKIPKLLRAFSIIASFFNLVLLVTTIVQGFGGLSAALSQYFMKKYGTNITAANQRRCGLTSISLFCLVTQNILILQKTKQDGEGPLHIQPKAIKIAFILISVSIMCQVPIIGFHLSLFIEISNQFDSSIVKFITFGESGISFIISIICWGMTFKCSLKQMQEEPKEQGSLNQKENAFAQNFIDSRREMQNLTSKPILQPLIQRQLQDKTVRTEQDAGNIQEDLRLSSLFSAKPINDNFFNPITPSQNHYNQQKKAISSRQLKKRQQHKIQKQLLKTQIQKKKKRFRELTHHAIKEQQGQYEESSYISVDDDLKMRNLPKTYRQYIKDAKKPRRQIKTNNLPISLIELKIDNLIQDPQIKRQNLNKKIRLFIEQDQANKEEELVITKKLKAKESPKKFLFEKTISHTENANEVDQTNGNGSNEARVAKHRKPRTAQELLMARLKERYNAFEISQDSSP